MNEKAFQNMPMVLETPIDKKGLDGKSVEDKSIWAEEIKLLESLVGMDLDTDEFRQLTEELHARGTEERRRIQDQVDKKAQKTAKKIAPASRKKKMDLSDDESE